VRLAELGLDREPISIRMTGCPNGCARPYMSEVGIVGVSGDRYNVYLGGSTESVRLNRLFKEMVPGSEIATVLDRLFSTFALERAPGESFGDYCNRAAFVPSNEVTLA
jgi:sulfite reductase beta subunit-like hemoprotein